MAYQLKSKTGQPIKKDGLPVMGMDQIGVKIEQLDDANLTFVAIASTEDEDRDKDIIRQAGWQLKNFKKNPIIPWSHNYWELPVAKAIRVWVDSTNKRLLFKPKFDANDEFSKKIFNKYANGFLTSFSVGFRAEEYTQRDPNDWWGGKEFTKLELLEISAVAVPANPNANVNLDFEGSGMVKSMSDIGYPDYFARRKDNWLFYPIRDVGQFTSPRQEAIADMKGAFAIYAHAIDESHPEGKDDVVVGYSFDPTEYDKDLAVEFVKNHGENKIKYFYYKLDFDAEKGVSINPIVEEYELSIKEDANVRDFDWGDSNVVRSYPYRVCSGKETPLPENEEKVEDQQTQDQTTSAKTDVKNDPPEKSLEEEAEELRMELLSMRFGKLSDAFKAFNEKFENFIKSNAAVLDAMAKTIEKLVVKQDEIGHNKDVNNADDSVIELEDDPAETKTDGATDDLEVTDEIQDDKTSSEETIEIDEADLKSVGDVGGMIITSLKDNIKQNLMDAVKNSGRID